jgi:hypothetical protein
VLVRRVIGGGTPIAVTDPNMLASIVDELMAYNPTAGAVTGVGFVRFNQLVIQADDGGMGGGMWNAQQGWEQQQQVPQQPYVTGGYQFGGDSVPGMPYPTGGFATGSNPPPPEPEPVKAAPPPPPAPTVSSSSGAVASGEIGSPKKKVTEPPVDPGPASSQDAETPTPVLFEAPVFPQGMRVLVSAPNGTLHSAVVIQHRGDYYEVEIGSTKDAIWVPQTHVIPDR